MNSTCAVITVSDRSFRGEREDLSGPAVVRTLEQAGFTVVTTEIVPDEPQAILAALMSACEAAHLVITTGGTGLSPRDVTPEATAACCERLVPGVAELMRAEGLKHTPMAPLSRGICGARGSSLVLNLPGSPKGAVESLHAILYLLPHALELLTDAPGSSDHGN